MKSLLDKLNINETFTKPIKKPKYFNKVKDIVPLQPDFNFMMDLLFLPTTEEGYKYLLVCVDLGVDEFDIEPIKNKDAPSVLAAFKKMIKRKYIKLPKYSLATDSGPEFMGPFQKYLYDNNVFHKIALPNRHSQMSNVESLNKQLGRLFNGYMNNIEEETGKQYNEWTDVIQVVREDLNKLRRKDPKSPFATDTQAFNTDRQPKFKVGDIVYRQSDVPLNALGKQQPTKVFRMGDYRYDKIPKKITEIIYMNSNTVPYRFMLEGLKNVSYPESQLIMAEAEKETKYKVRQIIGKKTIKKKIHYLVWWDGYLKKNATWELKDNLLQDGLKEYIDEYENS